MHWIFQFFLQNRNFTSLLLTVSFSLFLLASDPDRQERIASALLASVFYPLQYTVSLSSHVRNLFAENKKLRKQNMALSTEISLLEEQSHENQRLRALLNLEKNFSFDLVAARVIAREPSHQFRSIIVNCGHTRGISRFMPVISTNGVIGKTVQVLPRLSRVQLLRDPACRTGVMIKRTRVVGILETLDGTNFFMRCRAHEEVIPGDPVITSGLGGVFPKGLQVGEVVKLQDDPDPLFKQVAIRPYVDFAHVEEVFIINLSPRWSLFRQELDSLLTLQ